MAFCKTRYLEFEDVLEIFIYSVFGALGKIVTVAEAVTVAEEVTVAEASFLTSVTGLRELANAKKDVKCMFEILHCYVRCTKVKKTLKKL